MSAAAPTLLVNGTAGTTRPLRRGVAAPAAYVSAATRLVRTLDGVLRVDNADEPEHLALVALAPAEPLALAAFGAALDRGCWRLRAELRLRADEPWQRERGEGPSVVVFVEPRAYAGGGPPPDPPSYSPHRYAFVAGRRDNASAAPAFLSIRSAAAEHECGEYACASSCDASCFYYGSAPAAPFDAWFALDVDVEPESSGPLVAVHVRVADAERSYLDRSRYAPRAPAGQSTLVFGVGRASVEVRALSVESACVRLGTASPTRAPSTSPTPAPSVEPTPAPSVALTLASSAAPTTAVPSAAPSASRAPTALPTALALHSTTQPPSSAIAAPTPTTTPLRVEHGFLVATLVLFAALLCVLVRARKRTLREARNLRVFAMINEIDVDTSVRAAPAADAGAFETQLRRAEASNAVQRRRRRRGQQRRIIVVPAADDSEASTVIELPIDERDILAITELSDDDDEEEDMTFSNQYDRVEL